MSESEITLPGILQNYDKIGEIPQEMLPVEPFREGADPTKPLRGAIEAVLLARVAQPALSLLREHLNNPKPSLRWTTRFNMNPIKEIDQEPEHYIRSELLDNKKTFVLGEFRKYLEQSLSNEFLPQNRRRLPRKVLDLYTIFDATDTPEEQISGIIEASDTLVDVNDTLFQMASNDFPQVLQMDPSARQQVNLVANSYPAFVHILAARHVDVRMPTQYYQFKLGSNFTIEKTNGEFGVVLIDPAQYHQREQNMRKSGEITSQTIHCPFSASAHFTESFLDSDVDPLKDNPLKHTFTTLVQEFIGS